MRLKRMRERESFLELPDADISIPKELDSWSMRVRCAPGVALVAMAPNRSHIGAIALPDTASARCRPDFGWVVSCSDPHYGVGQMVGIRPYGGVHFKRLTFDRATVNPEPWCRLHMMQGWVGVLPDEPEVGHITLASKEVCQTGVVVSAHFSSPWVEQSRVVFSRRNWVGLYGLESNLSTHDRFEGALIMRESSILAELLPGGPDMLDARFLGPFTGLQSQITLIHQGDAFEPAEGWVLATPIQSDSGILMDTVRRRGTRCLAFRVQRSNISDIWPGAVIRVNPETQRFLTLGVGAQSPVQLLCKDDIWLVLQ